ncbi:MAG: hypothetical protein KDB47_18740, partial [Mycobacterium sp.]|nr:hypothetical protein [Mycobacterium sp.]
MSSQPGVAQRLGRILERITRQSGRLSSVPAYGTLLLGRFNESPERRRWRVQVILTVFTATVNIVAMAL